MSPVCWSTPSKTCYSLPTAVARESAPTAAPTSHCSVAWMSDDATLHVIETVETETRAHTVCWNAANKTIYAFLPVTNRVMTLAE